MHDGTAVRNCLLLTGADGYVGQRLLARLGTHLPVVALSRTGRFGVACDLLDRRSLRAAARGVRPLWIVHCAGNKNIGACEKSPALAYAANVRTTLNVLDAWPGVPLLYVSTDYVFCGLRGRYTELSPVAPATAYGRSKLCAETAGRLLAPGTFTSIRASALYDESATFLTFLSTELSAGRPVDCFVDAYYSPTCFDDFAAMVLSLLQRPERPDVVHVAGPRISRFDFAREYAAAFGFDDDLIRPVHLDPDTSTLFPDLSLATPIATATLGFAPTPHRVALERLTPARAAGSPRSKDWRAA